MTHATRMGITRSGALTRIVGCALLAAAASPAIAADTAPVTGGVLEEVTVTATKRAQSSQDVGIAMAAYSTEQLSALGVRDSIDIAAITPGVHIGGSIGGQTSLFTIRGVTQNDFTDTVESPVAIYVDDGYVAMAQGQTFGLFDLDRVEVSKGPQGTLFGRNATGGLIQFVTRQPTRDFESYVDVSESRFSNTRVEAAVGGPLGDMLAGRLSFMWNKFDPVMKNTIPASQLHPTNPAAPGGQNLWNDDTLGVRGALLLNASDHSDLTLSVQYERQKTSTAPYTNSASVPVYDQQGRLVETYNASPTETRLAVLLNAQGQDTGIAVPLGGGLGVLNGCFTGGGPPPAACSLRSTPGGDGFGYVAPKGITTQSDFAYTDLNHFSTGAAALHWNWQLSEHAKLSAITNYFKFIKYVAMDVDAAPEAQSIFHSRSDEHTFSQEVRLSGDAGKTRWVAGAYYLNVINETENGLLFPATSPFATNPLIIGAPGPVDTVGTMRLHTISTSLFGQVDLPLADRWTLVAGVRGVKEKKSYSFFQGVYQATDDRYINTAVLYAPLFPATPFSSDDTLWAGKLQLEFRPVADVLWYLGMDRGAKAGGFNAQLADGSPRLPLGQIPYKPETLTNYEVGFKSTVLGGRARVNGSAYYYDYKDYQAFLFQQSSGVVVNKDAFVRGVELEIAATPFSGLETQLGVSEFQAIVKNLQLNGPAGVAPLYRDVHPSFAPQSQLSGLLRYTWSLPQGRLAAQVDAHYTSDFYHNLRNFQADHYPGYTLANVRLAYTSGPWEVAAFVKNVTDKRYFTIGYDLATLCGCNENAFGAPRWPGAEVKYHFGK